jgi:hypothetical protein
MTNQETIKKINSLLNERVFSSADKLGDTWESASYSTKTNFKFELSNTEAPSKPNTHYFKVDSVESVGKIWKEITKNNTVSIDKILNDAISQFNIDLEKDLFLVIKIQ